MTIINRYVCESSVRPALQPAAVGSLLHSPSNEDFSVPPGEMWCVTAALTMRQVCFRSPTLLCVTAASEMCRAQLWDLDDSHSVGATDGV